MKAFIEGFGIGLGFVIFIGPVLFTLLQGSFAHGFRSGFAVAFGIIVSDIVAVLLLLVVGADEFFLDEKNQFYIALVGAVILFAFGLVYIIRPKIPEESNAGTSKTGYLSYFVKGFLVNFVNPFVFAVWISTIALGASRHPQDWGVQTFIFGSLVAIFLTDSLKAYFANRLRPLLSPANLKVIYRVSGGLLVLFGIRMIILVLDFDII